MRSGIARRDLSWQTDRPQVYYRHCLEPDNAVGIDSTCQRNEHLHGILDRHGDGLHHVKEWVDDCQKSIEEFRARGIEVIQSGKFDEDEHYYFDTESIFGYVYEIGNNGKDSPSRTAHRMTRKLWTGMVRTERVDFAKRVVYAS